jgi:hypothetical protein
MLYGRACLKAFLSLETNFLIICKFTNSFYIGVVDLYYMATILHLYLVETDFFPPVALQPLLGPGIFFSSVIIFYTYGSNPWTSDKPITRPLPTQRTTQTRIKHI